MKLIEKRDQFRRDYNGLYECEGCKEQEVIGGCYDDEYFHANVAPRMKCKKCGETTLSLGAEKQIVHTRYPEFETH